MNRSYAPRARIIAFEPDARSPLFGQSDPDVVPYNCALGEVDGEIDFYLPTYGRWACDGMGATSFEAAAGWLNDPGRLYRFKPSRLRVEVRSVRCRRLDTLAFHPALIKLHAQGAELAILKGGALTIETWRPALMIAFPSFDVIEFCRALGYERYVFAPRMGFVRNGSPARGATFDWFLHEEHLTW